MSTSYDEFTYPCAPQTQTHPDLLATLATLHGLTPPPTENCVVLEVGCNNGSNLIPMAANEPGSRFTGIDLAETAIEAARQWSGQLGLKNTEFLQADVTEWDPGERRFDYILIHGVYSWVPAHVREAILARCRASLSPNGLAYISYNSLPGCRFRQYVWDVLRFHTREIADPRRKIAAAREMCAKMCASLGDDQHQTVVKKEFELRQTVDESVLLHDDLAECNTPFHLSEFVEAAQRHELQYLRDAQFSKDSRDDMGLNGTDWLAQRQYGDFFTARRFRSSLLCQKEASIDRTIRPERVANLLASSRVEPEPEQSDGSQRFRLVDEKFLSTNHPAAKRVLTKLAGLWPGWLPVSELPLDACGQADAAELVLRLYDAGALELRLRPPRLVTNASDRPVASRLARTQLAKGLEVVTNQRHFSVKLTDALSRRLVMLLDGSRDRAALLRDLTEHFDPEKAAPEELQNAWHANGPASRLELAQMLDQGLDANLTGMARLCLLVG